MANKQRRRQEGQESGIWIGESLAPYGKKVHPSASARERTTVAVAASASPPKSNRIPVRSRTEGIGALFKRAAKTVCAFAVMGGLVVGFFYAHDRLNGQTPQEQKAPTAVALNPEVAELAKKLHRATIQGTIQGEKRHGSNPEIAALVARLKAEHLSASGGSCNDRLCVTALEVAKTLGEKNGNIRRNVHAERMEKIAKKLVRTVPTKRLELIKIAAALTGVDPGVFLGLGVVESSLGKTNFYQFKGETFADLLVLYGAESATLLQRHDSKLASHVRAVVQCISRDPKTGRIVYNEARYKRVQGKAGSKITLRNSISGLQDNLLLASVLIGCRYHDTQNHLASLYASNPEAMQYVRRLGPVGCFGVIHFAGQTGSKNIFSNPDKSIRYALSPQAIKQNGPLFDRLGYGPAGEVAYNLGAQYVGAAEGAKNGLNQNMAVAQNKYTSRPPSL